MRYAAPSLALLSLFPSALAAPAPVAVAVPISAPAPTAAPSLEDAAVALEERQLLGGLLGGINGLVTGLLGDVDSAVKAADSAAINSALVKLTAANRPTNVADACARASKIWASPTGRTDIFGAIATQVASGLGPLLDDTLLIALNGALPVGENSISNNNPRPRSIIYPRKDIRDAPYSLSEDALRKAIYIPPGFSYGSGSKRPIIMVPGTGAYGGLNFASNLRKLLSGQWFADPIWLNIPGAMLGDAQINAEYIAYAINYISAISNIKNKENLAVISWSQGGLDTQWAFKYWPSTRKVVKDFLPVSPDFKGTILANALCLSLGTFGLNPLCPPSVIQQEATSKYVNRLRSQGGDSAYVPTTTIYSGFFDEIVEPQQGTGASAYLLSNNGVVATNHEVQRVCAGTLAGGFYGHAGVLAHPLTYALIADALTHDGPGRVERINVNSVCDNIIAPHLNLDDFLATSGLIPIAGVLVLAYPLKGSIEPGLKSYASY
jgi:hypothetical protein